MLYPQWKILNVEYFGFVPNVVPRCLFPLALRVERGLEWLFGGRFGTHYMISLEKR